MENENKDPIDYLEINISNDNDYNGEDSDIYSDEDSFDNNINNYNRDNLNFERINKIENKQNLTIIFEKFDDLLHLNSD